MGSLFRFGLFEADVARNTLSRNGVRVKIQDQPFRALILLLQHPGEIVSREELRAKLWPQGTYVDFDGSLNVILKKLRAALEDNSDNPVFIETVPRRGYRFIAPVQVEEPKSAPALSDDSGDEAGDGADAARGRAAAVSADATRESRLHYFYLGMLAAAVVLLAAGGAWLALRRVQAAARARAVNPAVTTPVTVRQSVAVLGFQNVSRRDDAAWLSTALAEMLSTELSAGEKLRLVAGEDIANLRLAAPWPENDTLNRETAARIGQALNSDFLVLGSYTTLGHAERNQLRLDVRLQDAKTGAIFAEVAETGNSTDLFRLVSRIGVRLRGRLGVPELGETDEAGLLASLPLDPDAARFYALGLTKLRAFDALAAKDLLQQATQADPKFALAHTMLARAWAALGYEQKRKEEARKALDLSIDLPRTDKMQVEGDYYESRADHLRAASSYRALFELFPDSVEYGLQLASVQLAAGRVSEASETIARLRRLPSPAANDARIDLLEAKLYRGKDTSLVFIRQALRKASQQHKKVLYAQARRDECLNLLYGPHPEQAPAACEDAYNLFMAAGNRLGAADSVRLLADRQGYEGHYEQAIETYRRALGVLEGLGEHEKTGAILNNMAIDFANEGKLDQAEQLYRQARTHFEAAGDRANVATALVNTGDIRFLRGDLPAAERLYQQTLTIKLSLEPAGSGYPLFRLADLELTQGRIEEAEQHAQQAIANVRPEHGDYQDLTGAMMVLGDVLEAKGDLVGARRQFEPALAMREKVGAQNLVEETQMELAELALEEGRPEQAEPLLREAIAEFEKEKGDPDASSAYVLLSRTLLLQNHVAEARHALQRASTLSLTSADPALRLPVAIQSAKVELAAANVHRGSALVGVRQKLRTAEVAAQKMGYYRLACEARLAEGELQLQTNPAYGQAQLTTLAAEAHHHGLELIANKAQRVLAGGRVLAAVNAAH